MKKILLAVSIGLFCTHVFADTQNLTTTTSSEQTMTNSSQQNIQEGDTFLKTNKTKQGVVTLADGLQYKILKEGNGAKPKATDVVTVEYTGSLVDGTVFDASSRHGGTASFPVNQVIPGWTEVLQLMPTGSTWEVYIPSELAYGSMGAPPLIGPNKTLIFKIKLVGIK